jgi:hypothetical protein
MLIGAVPKTLHVHCLTLPASFVGPSLYFGIGNACAAIFAPPTETPHTLQGLLLTRHAASLIAQASARMDRTTAGSLMVTDIRESARQESVNSLVQLSCICAILAVAAGLFRYDLEVRNVKLTSWLPPALLRCATR